MTTPIEHGAVAVAVSAPALALIFTIWPFSLAFVAGCVALIYLAEMQLNDALKSVGASTFLGGTISQLSAEPALLIVGNINQSLLPWAKTAQLPMTAILAIVIGLAAQTVIPKLLNRAGRKIDGG